MISVTTLTEAWRIAKKMYSADLELDNAATNKAGYTIYRSTKDGQYYDYICELGDRLELNFSDCRPTCNIWIVKDNDEKNDSITIPAAEYKAIYEDIKSRYDEAIENEDKCFLEHNNIDARYYMGKSAGYLYALIRLEELMMNDKIRKDFAI